MKYIILSLFVFTLIDCHPTPHTNKRYLLDKIESVQDKYDSLTKEFSYYKGRTEVLISQLEKRVDELSVELRNVNKELLLSMKNQIELLNNSISDYNERLDLIKKQVDFNSNKTERNISEILEDLYSAISALQREYYDIHSELERKEKSSKDGNLLITSWKELDDGIKRHINTVILKRGDLIDLPSKYYEQVVNITSLDLSNPMYSQNGNGCIYEINDFSGLRMLPKLKKLILSGQTNLKDLSFVKRMSSLSYLSINGTKIGSLSSMRGVRSVQSLYCKNNNLRSLGGIVDLKKLEKLYCHENDNLSNISGLLEILKNSHGHKLTKVIISTQKVDKDEITTLKQIFNCNIGCSDKPSNYCLLENKLICD